MNSRNLSCSQYCKEIGIDPIGTAKYVKKKQRTLMGYLFISSNKIWERKIEKQPGLFQKVNSLLKKLAKEGKCYRLQAIKSDNDYCVENKRKIILYRREINEFGKFVRYEFDLEENKIFGFIKNSLLNNLINISQYQQINSTKQDVFVCTHTQRDICCGEFGFPLYKELKNRFEHSTIRIWRSSHIGGHRTAPTMIVFPYGQFWGYLTTDIASKIITKSNLSMEEKKNHFRGQLGLNPKSQVVDREGYMKFGWKWLNSPRNVATIEAKDDKLEIKLVNSKLNIRIKALVQNEPEVRQLDENKCTKKKSVKQHKILKIVEIQNKKSS